MADPRLLEPRELEALLLVDLPERPEWREGWQMLLDHIMAQAERIAEMQGDIQSWRALEVQWRTTEKRLCRRLGRLRGAVAAVVSGIPTQADLKTLKTAYEEDGQYG